MPLIPVGRDKSLNTRNSETESEMTGQNKVYIRQEEAGAQINLTEKLVRFEQSSVLLHLYYLSECTHNMWLSVVIKTI